MSNYKGEIIYLMCLRIGKKKIDNNYVIAINLTHDLKSSNRTYDRKFNMPTYFEASIKITFETVLTELKIIKKKGNLSRDQLESIDIVLNYFDMLSIDSKNGLIKDIAKKKIELLIKDFDDKYEKYYAGEVSAGWYKIVKITDVIKVFEKKTLREFEEDFEHNSNI